MIDRTTCVLIYLVKAKSGEGGKDMIASLCEFFCMHCREGHDYQIGGIVV